MASGAADVGAGAAETVGAGGRGPPPPRGPAHSEQNLAAGRHAAPQFGQEVANGVAHSMQNFAPARFSVPQFEQIIRSRLPSGSRPRAEDSGAGAARDVSRSTGRRPRSQPRRQDPDGSARARTGRSIFGSAPSRHARRTTKRVGCRTVAPSAALVTWVTMGTAATDTRDPRTTSEDPHGSSGAIADRRAAVAVRDAARTLNTGPKSGS